MLPEYLMPKPVRCVSVSAAAVFLSGATRSAQAQCLDVPIASGEMCH